MKNKITLSVLLALTLTLALSLGAAWAQDDQAFFGIFAETSLMVMPGMGGVADMLKDMPAGVPIPDELKAMLEGGKPERKLTMRLWSPGIASDDAFAWVAPPEGLGVGDRLDLMLYRPQPDEGDAAIPGMPDLDQMTLKIYWGSSPTVKPGQPMVIKFTDLPDLQSAQMREKMRAAMAEGGRYFHKPDWTTAYWPNEDKDPVTIGEEASLVGNYALTTNYTGNIEIEAPEDVEFLAPIELSSPDTSEAPDLEEALLLEWAEIPHALGIHAGIVGMEGRNTLVLWSSSETLDEDSMLPDMDYLEMAQVRAFVASGMMMPGDATECTAPEGIFAECTMPMLTMVGYGPGASLPEGQPLPRVQTKTTLGMQLGSMMAGMGGGR